MQVYSIRIGATGEWVSRSRVEHFKYVGIKEAAAHSQPTAFISELIFVLDKDEMKNVNDYATLLHP